MGSTISILVAVHIVDVMFYSLLGKKKHFQMMGFVFQKWLNSVFSGSINQIISAMFNAIHNFHIAHNTLCLSPNILHKHCFKFSLDNCVSQEKLKTMLMQTFGGQTK